jgi:hypothetical protein
MALLKYTQALIEVFTGQEWAEVEEFKGMITTTPLGISVMSTRNGIMDATDGTYVWDWPQESEDPKQGERAILLH